jgi:hypothetical protein
VLGKKETWVVVLFKLEVGFCDYLSVKFVFIEMSKHKVTKLTMWVCLSFGFVG